jgi:hypothetical protein
MRLIVLICVLGGLTRALAQEPTLPCPPGDKACARALMKTHPAKHPEFWKAALARPLEERIGPAPAELVELIALDNVAQGYPNKPRRSRLDADFLADVRRAFEGIPASVKTRLGAKLAGIYFVDDIGGTGYTDEVSDPSGKARLGFVILDPAVLARQKANAWATWKDNTPFKPGAGWALGERIENDANDNRANAIQYILLHEIGHVLSIGADFHPSWVPSPREVGPTAAFPFFETSWKIAGDAYVSRFDADFPTRKDVVFYFGAKLEAAALPEIYAALERTPFPTLYAATHPGDDFAEAFANYVHVVLLGKPFEIRITHDGALVKTYAACWSQARCAAKRAILERYLGAR